MLVYAMTFSDRYIFDHLRATAKDGQGKISLADLARKTGCHRNTASRAYHRLEKMGKIQTITGTTAGYIYRILSDE